MMGSTTSRAVRWLGVLALLLAVAGAGVLGGVYFAFLRDLPELDHVDDYGPALSSVVFDREGRSIGEFFVERRRLTPLSQVPDHVVRAFVAAEDSTFFEHAGIDFVSILRAAWVNLRAGGEVRQGASTITQQTVKGLMLTPERTLRRKVREMILARRLEQRFTKQEILYLYLNQIYFGHGAYGIGEAARSYFAVDVSELSISQGAMLAGLPKAPSRFSPFANPARAEARRRYVLGRMLEEGFLDEATHREALADVPPLVDLPEKERFADAAYFTEEVRRYLFDALGGDRVLKGGLRIETTLDADLQHAAVAAVRQGLEDLDRRQGYRGPQRRVEPDDLEAEITRLAHDNRLVFEAGETADAEEEEAAAALAAEPRALPVRGERLTGVVTRVVGNEQRAVVAFAPDQTGDVALKDVAWAREPNPQQAPRQVRSIEKIFAVGDVAVFELLEDAEPGSAVPVTLVQQPAVQGALFSIDVEAQEVLALVGGYDYEHSQFDRVVQAHRQPGSSFKPLIYGAAIDKGYTASTILFDRPVVYRDRASGFVWRPRNYGRSFYGPITMREALARSVNNATVHLFRDVGVDYVIRYAKRLGIESPLDRDLSLALGSSVVTLHELTRSYAVFPNRGRRVTPVFIRRVSDREGNVLLENVALGAEPETPLPAVSQGPEPVEELEYDAGEPAPELLVEPEGDDPDQLVSAEQAYLVADLLRAVVVDPDGTGWRLRDLGRPVAGKTGTTNDQADAWFIGFSPDVATGVWVGHDETSFLGWGETGSRAAAPIWVDYMKAALDGRAARDFPVPDGIVFARIDRKTGLLADAQSQQTVFQPFAQGTVPTETSSSAQTRSEGRRLLRMDDF